MPLWQWIVIYSFIAFIIYGVVYYVFLANQPVYNAPSSNQNQLNTPTTNLTALTTRNDPTKGNFIADSRGMSLYTFDKDTPGVSNCNDACLVAWPPFLTSLSAQDALPDNLTIINRVDNTSQFAWKGLPLYYYSKDINPGDILGDGFNGIWHIVQP